MPRRHSNPAPKVTHNAMTTETTTAPASGFSEAAFHEFLRDRDEPGWLVDRRREAFATFQSLPLPTLRDEEWRRTDIRALKLDTFSPPARHTPSSLARSELAPAFDALSGHYATGLEHVDPVPTREADASRLNGAIFLDLDQAVKECPDLVKRHLFTSAYDPKADAFAALHAAFFTGGSFLYVPKGADLEAPLFTLVGLSAAGRVDLHHTLVVLEEGAQASLVQETASRGRADAPALHFGGVELIVGPEARLRFVNIQNWDGGTWHFSRERAVVERDGRLQWTVGGLGSRLSKVNQEVALVGQGARAQVNGIMFTSARQHLAYFTRQDHVAPHTTSDLLYKGGVKDRSRLVWKGMIRVEKDAQKTDAYQKNEDLVLADTARADSIPGLEIEANDVRCTHGATSSRIDPEQEFYLQSRGIAKEQADELLTFGFFEEVLNRLASDPLHDALRALIQTKFKK